MKYTSDDFLKRGDWKLQYFNYLARAAELKVSDSLFVGLMLDVIPAASCELYFSTYERFWN